MHHLIYVVMKVVGDMVDMVKNRGRDEEGGLLNPEGGQNHSLEE